MQWKRETWLQVALVEDLHETRTDGHLSNITNLSLTIHKFVCIRTENTSTPITTGKRKNEIKAKMANEEGINDRREAGEWTHTEQKPRKFTHITI